MKFVGVMIQMLSLLTHYESQWKMNSKIQPEQSQTRCLKTKRTLKTLDKQVWEITSNSVLVGFFSRWEKAIGTYTYH